MAFWSSSAVRAVTSSASMRSAYRASCSTAPMRKVSHPTSVTGPLRDAEREPPAWRRLVVFPTPAGPTERHERNARSRAASSWRSNHLGQRSSEGFVVERLSLQRTGPRRSPLVLRGRSSRGTRLFVAPGLSGAHAFQELRSAPISALSHDESSALASIA